MKSAEVCRVMDCGRAHKARGYCNSHYAQWLRGINVDQPINERNMLPPETCTVEGCVEAHKARGLCHMHYARQLRHGHVKRPDRTKPRMVCSVIGCDSYTYAKGVCNLHYVHARKMENYGIDTQEYQRLLVSQGGGCAICGGQETSIDDRSGKPRMLAVDHNHATGKVRGILCSHCNRAIGLLGDSVNTVQSALMYLEAHASSSDKS